MAKRKRKSRRKKAGQKPATTATPLASEARAKIDLVATMIRSLSKLSDVEMQLRFAGDFARADEVQQKSDVLLDAIKVLRGRVAETWTRDTEDLRAGLAKANIKVQASVREIEKGINVAQNVVKVIGQIDSALAAVQGLVK